MTLRNRQKTTTDRLTRSLRSGHRDRLRRKRLEKRRSIVETLENRQLLAGPELVGIQPSEGSLLNEGTVLNVSPREIVFQFDDATEIDTDTLGAIRITRAGEDRVFESASVTSDLGTGGQVLVEFRSTRAGSIGNGIDITFTESSRVNPAPILTVDGRSVNIELNNNPAALTRVGDLISTINSDPLASSLIEAIQVSGPSLQAIGSVTAPGTNLVLTGANSAEAITDFGSNGLSRVRFVSQVPGAEGRGIRLEVSLQDFGGPANPLVFVTDQVINVRLNSSFGFESTVGDLIQAINTNADASSLVIASLQEGDLTTAIGRLPTDSYSPLTLTGVSDEVVQPGFIGLGESSREVVFRFAEPLPDDIYQIDIVGTGVSALRNVDGDFFQNGIDFSQNFSINLGPQVVAVVPEPVRRNSDGSLSPEIGFVEVHFNDDDLAPSLAENPNFYQLIYTRDTVSNTDDTFINPISVDYNSITNTARLNFGRPLSRVPDPNSPLDFLGGAARLRVGTSEGLPAPPTEVSLFIGGTASLNEPGDSFDTAFDLNSQWAVGGNVTQSATLQGEIFNTEEFGLDLPGPDLPGTRNIRPEDPTSLTRAIPLDFVRNGADAFDGISVFQYDFADSWLGDDPSRPGIIADTTYFNIISEQQRQRVREVLQLFSEYLGVNFVEVEGEPTSSAFFSIAVGDLYGADEQLSSGAGGAAVGTRDRNGDGIDDIGVLDFQDFDESTDDQFGGEFFRGAMFLVGQLLGYGFADDLPQPVTQSTDFIFAPGTDNEPAFPSVADIVHGQFLFRPDSTDIDLYRFTLPSPGELSVETIAERLGVPSLLDTSVKLYQQDTQGAFVEIAQNDDYFSNDSQIRVSVDAGTYIVGVSAKGNEDYDPSIPGTGFGGLSEGEYELRLDFSPNVTNAILDASGVALDGDADGVPGGSFDFWFVPADPGNTLYVDKAGVSTGATLGSVGNPFTEIDQAIAAAQPGDTIRVVGNGGIDGLAETFEDNFSYQIGISSNGLPLEDGSSLDVPQGVQLVIDSTAIIKLSRSRLGVGSVSPLVDRSDSSLQILGTPSIIAANGLPARDSSNEIIPGSVILTSINDNTVGIGNILANPNSPQPADWGGIDFRGDLDSADESRRNRENEGVFLNHIQYADIRYGGGSVSIGGNQVVVSPIDLAITRPTIINSRITDSADAAIAATPDTFAETSFTDPRFQGLNPFTPDYSRVGPEIHGNTIIDNSINGLFLRLVTRTGDVLETVNVASRFDDTDITHVLAENLVITGTPGGPVIQSTAPSSLLIRPTAIANGAVPAGTYVYRITNVNSSGLESAASQPSIPVTLTSTGGVQLQQLPTVASGTDFVSRRLYRATVINGVPGQFTLVAQLNASSTTFNDLAAAGNTPLGTTGPTLRSRLDASLVIDPGTVLKIDGARIEARFGANLVAEGLPSQPVVFTSIDDQRYGAGGTFDTSDRGDLGVLAPGDWGGIYVGHGSSASIDHGVIAGGGGTTRIEGGFASFNALEVHQADLRLTNTLLEQNADGRERTSDTRVGRGDNSPGSIFINASQPIIVGNDFVDGAGVPLSFDVNALNSQEVNDPGRSTGLLDRVAIVGNTGPLIQGNSFTGNAINGLQVRGGELATAGVWDDVDIVHVVNESIEIPNQHIFGGLRLQSDARGSLVVKFETASLNFLGSEVGVSGVVATAPGVGITDTTGTSSTLVTAGAEFPSIAPISSPTIALPGAEVNIGEDFVEVDFSNSGGGTGESFIVIDFDPAIAVSSATLDANASTLNTGVVINNNSLWIDLNDVDFDATSFLRIDIEGLNPAGIVVGGALLSAEDQFRDIPDRIGGALQVIGHPDFPVVLTTLQDDFSGAGFTRDGLPAVDTNGDGILGGDLSGQNFAPISPNGGIPSGTDGPSFNILPTGPEVNQGLRIDNDVNIDTPGSFAATIGDANLFNTGADSLTYETPAGLVLTNQNLIFQYSTYIAIGNTVTELSQTTITQNATLVGDDIVESEGNFAGPNGQVNWVARSSFIDGVATLFTTLELTAEAGDLGAIRVISYLDEDINAPGDDILVPVGTPGEADFRLFTLDGADRTGFAHGGFYIDDGVNLANAAYVGWAADIFNDLQLAIEAGTQTFSIPGDIDLADLPTGPDPDFGTILGPGDATTAFAWDTNATSTTAVVTSFLELLSQDPVAVSDTGFEAGLWNGITIREAAHDRNVAAIAEEEPNRTAIFGTNDIPSQSQFLGEIAPNEQSGDENRRLGFIVDGSITTRDDLDVYSFIAESNTEVFLDIDRTGNQFDSVVELIDANGVVLASSNDSILAETNPAALFIASNVSVDAAQPLTVVPDRLSAQELTVDESIVDATGGNLTLTLDGSNINVEIAVGDFIAEPALSVQGALEATYPDLALESVTLLRRTDRIVDPTTGFTTRNGEDYVIRVQFDETQFVGQTPPTILIAGTSISPASILTSEETVLLDSQLQDDYSTNSKDAGLRIRLPGEANTRNLYHIRVRSANTADPLDFATLTNPSLVRDGLTLGRYELQVRLQETDERAGTQIRLADIRYATNGVQIIGQPLHSPLLGEEAETSAPNDTIETAQPLGFFGVNNDAFAPAGPLQSDRLAQSFGGEISSATDVDWYQFNINYENLTRDQASLYLSTVFDLDYASNFARADLALYVFNAAGQLILVGGDSNIADDQPGSATSNDTGNLDRGSAGVQDPFIGATELLEGTYFVAVSNQSQVPAQLDQFTNAASLNPLLRLEPVDSVTRIVEDHILDPTVGTASPPEVPVLFDNDSIQEFTFDDVLSYVNTPQGLFLINPFTGENFGNVGNFDNGREFQDIAFTANGELFGYSDFVGAATDTSWFYHRIETADASVGAPISVGAGIETRQWDGVVQLDGNGNVVGVPTLNVVSNTGLSVEAITIREFGGTERGYFLANRPVGGLGVEYIDNVLYRFDEQTGLSDGGQVNPIFVGDGGAGTNPREVGQLDTTPLATVSTQLGISDATTVDASGIARQELFDGDSFTLNDLVNPAVTFEFDQSFTLTANGTPIRDGDAIDVDGQIFEFDTGTRIVLDAVSPAGALSEGAVLTVFSGGVSTQYEFVRLGQPQFGNIPIATVDGLGQPRSLAAISADLAAQINANVANLGAVPGFGEVFFTGVETPTLTISGPGVSLVGSQGSSIPGSTVISISEDATADEVIDSLGEVLRANGVPISAEGTQLAFPSSGSATVVAGTGLIVSGSPGVTPGNIPILLLPGDSAELLGERISNAVAQANASGQLPNVSAVQQGHSLNIIGAVVAGTSGSGLVAGGISPGGNVTGIELVDDNLFAVTDTGGFFRVSGGELSTFAARQVGVYESRATDLIGINFSGLRAGPASVQDGELRNILFGITDDGDIHAFNTFGELQPVFAGGRSVISTGIAGAEGLDFNTLDFNLWHFSTQRDTDLGHGIPALSDYRPGTEGSLGNASLVFNYERNVFASNFASAAEVPDNTPARIDGEEVEGTFNFPAGAQGVVNSNSFSLEGYSANDQPTLYFNYFLETDATDDRLRVFAVTEDGVEHLLASNSTARGGGTSDDEFDDPPQLGLYDDDIDVSVQQLFDNPTDGTAQSWRQARIPLNEFAGERNLSLRIEFSTNGTTTNTDINAGSLRVLAGDQLIEGQSLTIDGETFVVDFAPTLGLPSGTQVSNLYLDPAAQAVVTIDGQEYLLNDGTRVAGTNQIPIDLLSGAPQGTVISDLSAGEIAAVVAEFLRTTPPANPIIQGFDFSDPIDSGGNTENDFIFEATQLPYSGGNLTISGSGRFGTDPLLGAVTRIDDVDLQRLDVQVGTTIAVDLDLDFNIALDGIVRFFDADGNPLPSIFNTVTDTIDYTATADGTVFIGFSGQGNATYDPRLPGTATAGQVDGYTATISINRPLAILTDGNAIELNGLTSLNASPNNVFSVTGTDIINGTPINVSRLMSSSEVAEQVQRAIANRFRDGVLDSVPTSGPTVTLPDFAIDDPGPFALASERFADQFQSANRFDGARDNQFEGAYLDDFIIGFAERGEISTGSNLNTTFVADAQPFVSVPNDPISPLQTGTYQVEIRDASEFIASQTSTPFRTFDTNDRLGENVRSITALSADQLQDGFSFSISDGRSTVEFEFNQIESNTGVTPGRVEIPYTLDAVEPGTEDINPITGEIIPGTGVRRPQTATEVAFSIIEAINRSDVQSVIDVPALSSSGVDAVIDPRINLFGNVVIDNGDNALGEVALNDGRGDVNRSRDAQGVILIENSRFLSNEQYGIDISHGLTANINGTETSSIIRYPRNLIELNTENLVPGVVVQSNVFAFNGTGGLQIEGFNSNIDETGSDPVAFDRIINNTFIGGSITAGREAPSDTFQGILFDQGVISFADEIIDFSPDAGGAPPTTVHQNATNALGAPEVDGRGPEPLDGLETVSLGLGGTLTVQFTDNLLTGSGNAQPDLIIFETGAVESIRVEISRDGTSFFDVGILGGLSNTIDIDAFDFGSEDRFSFVRLTDLRQGDTNTAPLGADIDAIGALSTVPIDEFEPGGIGINIEGNAAPTLLNNVIANSIDGIQVDPSNTGIVLGANTFYRNETNAPLGVSLGDFAQVLSDAEVVFSEAADLVFVPAAGASVIDSSIDSLEDRASLTTVRNPLGIPPSPILAPRLDVNGQLRVDDPNVETPDGFGERVFIDRGASDRGDLDGPRAVLLSPRAPGLGIGAGTVNVLGAAPTFFEIQLIDGLAPADVTPGTGINDQSIDGDSLLIFRDNEPLVEGIDYRFGYNPSTNIIRLTPIAGVWEQDSTYVVRLIDGSDAVIAAVAGDSYTDGDILNVLNPTGGVTPFEYETGISVDFSNSLTGEFADGLTLSLFDGNSLINLELDSDGITGTEAFPVSVPAAGTVTQIAEIVAGVINSSAALDFTASVSGSTIQLLGGTPLSVVTSSNSFATVSGGIGTLTGFGFQIPAELGAPDPSFADGQSFIIRRGAISEVTFEFDTSGGALTDPTATAITLSANPSLDEIADAVVRAVGGAGLGLTPSNEGFGRVFLGGDTTYSLIVEGTSNLQQIQVPGQGPTIPIVIPIQLDANDVSTIIAETIQDVQLPNVTASVIDSRVFLEGTGGVSGVGAVDLIIVQDEVGNQLQSNQSNGQTLLTIFVGSGSDFGDAPLPYISSEALGGPSHGVDPAFSLGATVTPDADAQLADADVDDGIVITSGLQRGFSTNIQVDINNQDNRQFYLDAWFDWDQDGAFEADEQVRFGSEGTGRAIVFNGANNILVNVPSNAAVGSTFARFRLSESAFLGPNGEAASGEVEDVQIIVTNNPFQNAFDSADVNASGSVTPLDPLLLINYMAENGLNTDLSDPFINTADLPPFPDVDGNGILNPVDAIIAINRLADRVSALGEQILAQSSSTVATNTNGVLATSPTALGDQLISQRLSEVDQDQDEETILQTPAAPVDSQESNTSVFDQPAVVQLDSVVDQLAQDTAEASVNTDANGLLDQVFAELE